MSIFLENIYQVAQDSCKNQRTERVTLQDAHVNIDRIRFLTLSPFNSDAGSTVEVVQYSDNLGDDSCCV